MSGRPFVEVTITRGQKVLIDEEDAPLVGLFRWRAVKATTTGAYYAYAHTPMVSGRRGEIKMHRLVLGLGLEDRDTEVDHINRNTLDNRKSNLRKVTRAQNQHNRSNARGYTWCRRMKKWKASIRINGAATHLGYFETEAEASQAYVDATHQHFPIAEAV